MTELDNMALSLSRVDVIKHYRGVECVSINAFLDKISEEGFDITGRSKAEQTAIIFAMQSYARVMRHGLHIIRPSGLFETFIEMIIARFRSLSEFEVCEVAEYTPGVVIHTQEQMYNDRICFEIFDDHASVYFFRPGQDYKHASNLIKIKSSGGVQMRTTLINHNFPVEQAFAALCCDCFQVPLSYRGVNYYPLPMKYLAKSLWQEQ